MTISPCIIYEYCTDFCDTASTLSNVFASYLRIIRRFLTTSTLRCSPTCGFFSRTLTYANTHQAGSERAQGRAWWCGPQRGPSQAAMALSEVGEHYSVAQQQVQELWQRLRERRVQLCDIHFLFSLSRFLLFLFFLVYFISCCFFNPVRRCVINFYFQLLKERENFARDSGELAVKNWSCFSVCVFFVCRIEANANLLGNESSIFAAWTLCSDDDSQWRKREIRSFAETAEKKEVWK